MVDVRSTSISDAFFGYLDSDQLLQPGHETFDTDTGLDSFTGLVESVVSQENMIYFSHTTDFTEMG